MYATEDYIKAGAVLAVGIVNSGVKNDCDPAFAILSDYLDKPNSTLRIAALLGYANKLVCADHLSLGIAYAGSAREDLMETLSPIVEDSSLAMEVVAMAGLALGMIFSGTAHPELVQIFCQTLMERDEPSLNVTHARFLSLGLGLLFLGKLLPSSHSYSARQTRSCRCDTGNLENHSTSSWKIHFCLCGDLCLRWNRKCPQSSKAPRYLWRSPRRQECLPERCSVGNRFSCPWRGDRIGYVHTLL